MSGAAAGGEKVKIIVKKKKGGGHGHHGGAWKVAYADFVTAMMALFMVLWLLTQADLQTRAAIAQYFRNPGLLNGGAGVTAARDKNAMVPPVMESLATEARKSEQKMLENEAAELNVMLSELAGEHPDLREIAENLEVKVTESGIEIEMIDTDGSLLFESASSQLKPAVVRVLEKLAPVLAQVPNPIHVGGHTDSTPFPAGSGKTNWDLSYERANSARLALQKAGLRPGQATRVEAYADSKPLDPERPEAAKNRRLSLLVARRGGGGAPGDAPLGEPPEAQPEPPPSRAPRPAGRR
jgi:chemotaxis protein MotB